jgi:hypothetical protein
MTRCNRQFILVAAASLVPLSYFLFPFLCGFWNLSQGCLMLLAPLLLFGPLAAAIAVGILVPGISKASRFSVGFTVWIVTVALFFVSPAGAKSWTLGFATNFWLTKHPRQVQAWAVGILDRYEAGQLTTTTNAPYWAVGRVKLDSSEVPAHIGTLWHTKPSIGIVTMTSEGWVADPSSDSVPGTTVGKPSHCVAFSWYLTGILVGRSDFRSTWNPWYLHEIAPGVYAYCGMK